MTRDLVLLVSLLVVGGALFVPQWVLRKLNQAYIGPVEELPPLPITLRPYGSITLLSICVGLMCLAFALPLLNLEHIDKVGMLIFVSPLLALAAFGFIWAYLYSHRSIVLEKDKLIYTKVGRKVVVDFSDIKTFSVSLGYLNIVQKSTGTTTKVSLYFKHIRLLNAVLKQWFSHMRSQL